MWEVGRFGAFDEPRSYNTLTILSFAGGTESALKALDQYETQRVMPVLRTSSLPDANPVAQKPLATPQLLPIVRQHRNWYFMPSVQTNFRRPPPANRLRERYDRSR